MPLFKAVITAGGSSSRFGKNKLFENLDGKPIIAYSVDLFTQMGMEIIVPTNSDFFDEMKNLFKNYKNVTVIKGGNTRQASVFEGLKAIKECEFVIIHDGARPLISKKIVEKAMTEVLDKKAVIVAVKTTDTIKTVNCENKITSTLNRAELINVQTPQIFDYKLILSAHEKYRGKSYTDDACLAELENVHVYYVDGEYSNIKITNEIDLSYAKILLKNQKFDILK